MTWGQALKPHRKGYFFCYLRDKIFESFPFWGFLLPIQDVMQNLFFTLLFFIKNVVSYCTKCYFCDHFEDCGFFSAWQFNPVISQAHFLYIFSHFPKNFSEFSGFFYGIFF